METPSALENQVMCWSDYKHHFIVKLVVEISQTGLISFVSRCNGGRASNQYIFRNCGFYNFLEPYDQLMADCGFKIKDVLA